MVSDPLEPTEPRGREVGIDLFDLGVGVVARRAEFAAETALLVPSPGSLVKGQMEGVDPRHPGAEFANETLRPRSILGENSPG